MGYLSTRAGVPRPCIIRWATDDAGWFGSGSRLGPGMKPDEARWARARVDMNARGGAPSCGFEREHMGCGRAMREVLYIAA